MPRASRSSKPLEPKGCTPIGLRRFFFKLELLGKRRRTDLFYDYSNLDPVVDTPPEKAPYQTPFQISPEQENFPPARAPAPSPSTLPGSSPADAWPRPERVALINEDYAEDAVVITAFDDVPFCCHEDLLTMSRDHLIGVALALNAKLPSAMAIDIDHALPTSFIRGSIERIVGLRRDVPQAPKALRLLTDSESDNRLRADFDMQAQMDKTPPTSPLASRSRSYGQLTSLISPRLARLQEVEEEEFDIDAVGRHLKKRKLLFDNTDTENDDSDVDMSGPVQTPTPLPRLQRARSHHLAPIASPIAPRVLRSHSQKLDKTTTIDTTFVNTKRSAYRYQSKAKRPAAETKADETDPIVKPISVSRRTGRLRPRAGHRKHALSKGDNGSGGAVPGSVSSQMNKASNNSPAPAVVGAKRKRNVSQTEAEKQMTSGIGKMNVGQSRDSDDMDVGP